jgi:hypothetical protein
MIQNLLSQQQKVEIRAGYRKRLWVIMSMMVFFASIVSIITFVPVYLMASIKTLGSSAALGQDSEEAKRQAETLSLPQKINANTNLALSFKQTKEIANKIYAISKAASTTVLIDSIAFRSPDKMILSGISQTRESLLAFNKRLREIDFIKNTDVPVGSFAKDQNLAFNIAITLNP